jgi:hypothetical protein
LQGAELNIVSTGETYIVSSTYYTEYWLVQIGTFVKEERKCHEGHEKNKNEKKRNKKK